MHLGEFIIMCVHVCVRTGKSEQAFGRRSVGFRIVLHEKLRGRPRQRNCSRGFLLLILWLWHNLSWNRSISKEKERERERKSRWKAD